MPEEPIKITNEGEQAQAEVRSDNATSEVLAEVLVEPSLEEQLAQAQQKADSYLKSWQREAADFRNYKRRVDQERDDFVKYSNLELVRRLVPLVDDFERAFETLPLELAQLTWCEGILLIYRKMQAILEQAGLTEIEAMEQTFDPLVHEAVLHEEAEGGESGKVAAVLQKGYRFRDRILRPAMVKVAK